VSGGAPAPATVPLSGYPRSDDADMIRRVRAFHERMRTRRTVRDFDTDPVPDEVVEQALLAAGTAPSGANRQPWHFVVIRDTATRRRIRQAAEAEERDFYEHRAPPEWLEALAPLGTGPDKPFIESAPVLIAIFGESYGEQPDGTRSRNYYVTESVGLATGFLIAALHHAGLATLTHTPSPMRFLNELLGRPARERPFLLLVAGHPARDAKVPAAALAKKPLAAIASFA
jgi:iodotyrosine deiodinase